MIFYIGRQPILNEKGQIDAYELLYRQPGENSANVTDNSAATARVLINAIQNIGLESLLGGKKGFINADEGIILEGVIDILPKDQFVIEILETTKVTDEIVDKITEYKKQGYTFALDDMVLTKEYFDTFKRLFGVVDIIKIDYMFCDKEQLKKEYDDIQEAECKDAGGKGGDNRGLRVLQRAGLFSSIRGITLPSLSLSHKNL